MSNSIEAVSDNNESLTENEKQMGMLSHLLTFCGFVIPFANIIAPLIVYLTKKDESEYIRHHAQEALNFQLSVLIYVVAACVLILVAIGVFLLPLIAIANVVLVIVAAIKANEGKYYRYPLCIRFIS